VPGINGTNILRIPAGAHKLRIEALGNDSSAETTITILDEQPFADARNLECSQGELGGDGTCELLLTWENPGPAPENYQVTVDGQFFGALNGEETEVAFPGATPGEHCATLIGILGNDEGNYQGCFVRSCCDLTCTLAEYLPGDCGSQGEVNLTSAVFLLNHLFQGGEIPPCRVACDADASDDVNLTDAVRILQFLFQGGPPPAGWEGMEPTCVPVAPGQDCEIPGCPAVVEPPG
jgi:hypothetical protein